MAHHSILPRFCSFFGVVSVLGFIYVWLKGTSSAAARLLFSKPEAGLTLSVITFFFMRPVRPSLSTRHLQTDVVHEASGEFTMEKCCHRRSPPSRFHAVASSG